MVKVSLTHHPIGIAAADEQHDGLAAAIACIARLLKESDREEVRAQLATFLDLARVHFDTEEEHMLAHGYPAFADHRAEHTSLALHLETLCQAEAIDADLPPKLMEWFTSHAEGPDRAYGRWLL